MRPRHIFFSIFVLLSVLMASVGAYAQEVEPPYPPGKFDLDGYSPEPTAGQPGSAPETLSPSIGLGRPGLSYRYIESFGVSESPYNADNKHFEQPTALGIDPDQKVYVVDEKGSRILKFNKNKVYQWSLGIPGMQYIEEDVDVFNWPRDVGIDGGKNIWIVDGDRVIQYDSSGNYLQIFPKWEDKPWRCADDNGHFCWPGGVAFDSNDWMYVSDSDNQRVQVFKFSGGEPVYYKTIGTTGNPGNGSGQFDNPGQIAIDSSNNLFVADRENARIQKCVYNAGPENWTCSTFHGSGSFGSGDNDLERVEGLGIFGTTLYIADSGNDRIKKCDLTAMVDPCDIFATDVPYPTDVAAISASRILVIHSPDFTVHEYNGSGADQNVFAGIEGVPYKTDNKRLNRPWGVAVAADGTLYVSEDHGNRLVKMDHNGAQLNSAWPIGEPGIWGEDNYHFDQPRGNLAIDAQGQILVPDMWNHRVQIYDPAGNHKYTLGTSGKSGDDKYHFRAAAGAAVSPMNGDIYVADRRNHRVQVFKSNYQWKATLGQTGNPGDGNNQFNEPFGVAVDKNGDIYVADRRNHRVQIFDKNRIYKATLGKTGECEWGFGYVCAPHSVIVDQNGRIFVAESWENRVQVFDKDYKYLTTIGGDYSSSTGGFREPTGLALDKLGNLYIADSGNHRVQKFSPVVFGWQQSNLDGFGEISNIFITALKSLDNSLVAGTYNTDLGAQLWKLGNPGWTMLMENGFGNSYNFGVTDLEEFKGKYYACTSANETDGGEIWRSGDLSSWDRVVKEGFGDPKNGEISSMVVFKDKLYGSTWSFPTAHGTEIWRSGSGDTGSWNWVAIDGFGDSNNAGILSLTIHNNILYASTSNQSTGSEVWRSSNGNTGSWGQVNIDGFGNKSNQRSALASYEDYLYAGTFNRDSSSPGGELWRCKKCDGTDWKKISAQKGFGDPNNWGLVPLGVPGNSVYVFTDNRTSGLQIWMAPDGENFSKVGPDGFGDSRNLSPGSFAVHDTKLYVGTGNWSNAAEIWQREGFYFLPNIFKD